MTSVKWAGWQGHCWTAMSHYSALQCGCNHWHDNQPLWQPAPVSPTPKWSENTWNYLFIYLFQKEHEATVSAVGLWPRRVKLSYRQIRGCSRLFSSMQISMSPVLYASHLMISLRSRYSLAICPPLLSLLPPTLLCTATCGRSVLVASPFSNLQRAFVCNWPPRVPLRRWFMNKLTVIWQMARRVSVASYCEGIMQRQVIFLFPNSCLCGLCSNWPQTISPLVLKEHLKSALNILAINTFMKVYTQSSTKVILFSSS